MSIDLSQFHQVFYEEGYEGLDIMESGLLEMDIGQPDIEVVNDIFRAAHSIKGGAGTFGFTQVADFTHVVETLLDEVRSGGRSITSESLDLLLASVDCIRGMLQQLQSGQIPDENHANELKFKFDRLLSDGESDCEPNSSSTETQTISASNDVQPQPQAGWQIDFIPNLELLQTGNEPTRMFRQLSELCDHHLTVRVVADRLPTLNNLNPEHCYLAWHIELHQPVKREDIDEVFEWVVDDADITIAPLFVCQDSTDPSSAENSVEESDKSKGDQTLPVSQKIERPANKPSTKQSSQESSSIRVSIDKVDSLINMVGELVITQSMLGQLGRDFDISRIQRLQEGLAQLEHNTRELQESVMKIRMMPISFVFSRFPRLVRDVSRTLDKKIELDLSGENTELDKTVMEKIGDPLVHLIRNSIDHGIEKPETRLAKGKCETGTINLNAYHQSGNIVIEIKDDGAGLDTEKILLKARENGLVDRDTLLTQEQIFDLIFHAGFSTADQVSDLSGRGVGMDVVRRNIEALNGTIEVFSEMDKGTRFVIRLPLTLAILDGQLVRVKDQIYIFPLVSIVESIQTDDKDVNNVAGSSDVLQLRDEYVPILQLSDVFNIKREKSQIADQIIVVVEADGEKSGVVVDELLGQQQVVIKSLEENYRRVEGISGATILGDGTVALIIDISGLAKMAGISTKHIDNTHKAA